MVLPALSMSISHSSFQAELEGAILQQTASVDLYLQTAAPKWSPECYAHDDGCEGTGLRSLFLSDLSSASGTWQPLPSVISHVDPAWALQHGRKRRPRLQPLQAEDGATVQLEQFLQDDLHRFMELREQLDSQASASDAAVLASTADERQRRLSNTSSCHSGISFVKLPTDDGQDDEEEEGDDQHHPVAAALAAAMAMGPAAVAASAAAALPLQAQLLPAVQDEQGEASTAAAEVPAQQELSGSTTSSSAPGAAAATAAPATQFVMQPDEEIAEQKRAARAKLAELEGNVSAEEACPSAEEAAASSAKGWGPDWQTEEPKPGSMHTTKVPERPRGLAAMPPMPPSKPGVGYRPLLGRMLTRLAELTALSSEGVLPEHSHFLQHMSAGLVMCVVLLPVLWLLQADGGRGAGIVRSLLPAASVVKAEQLCNLLYICSAVGVLLYCLVRTMLLPTPLLNFREPALERQYLLWSNSGRLLQDCVFQLTFLVVGSCLWLRLLQSEGGIVIEGAQVLLQTGPALAGRLLLSALTLVGSSLPVVMLVVLRGPRYVKWREPLLAGSRLCSVLALSMMQLAAGPDGTLQLNMPFIAFAQVMSIACMQVRLSSFVPAQVLHLLVLVLCSRAVNPLLQFAQLFGGWLCLPCLVLFSMEMHSRKAFLSTLAPPVPCTQKAAGRAR